MRNEDPTIIEIKMDDGARIILGWTRDGQLRVQRYSVANVKDGTTWLSASGSLSGASLHNFLKTGLTVSERASEITQRVQERKWLEERN